MLCTNQPPIFPAAYYTIFVLAANQRLTAVELGSRHQYAIVVSYFCSEQCRAGEGFKLE